MKIYDDVMEQMALMRRRQLTPHTISFSNKGWDRCRAEVERHTDPFSVVAIGPRTYMGLPYITDRKQTEPVLVLTREQMVKKRAEAGVAQLKTPA